LYDAFRYAKEKHQVRNVLERVLTETSSVTNETTATATATLATSEVNPMDISDAIADNTTTDVDGDVEVDAVADAKEKKSIKSTEQDIDWESCIKPALNEKPQVCVAERKSLLKSLLKFLLSIVQEPAFATAMRTVVEGSLLGSLESIIRNPQYYGTTLWSSASKWVTEFCNNEPNLLHVVQDAGIHDAILEVLKYNPPPCADVLAELPNILSTICLNEHGLKLFAKFDPLQSLQQIFATPTYLPHINNETAATLGSAMDELLRHHPTLGDHGADAIISLLTQLLKMGEDPEVVAITGGCDFASCA
jgi:E3 ubiquitin-protein ligase HUWE1